MNYNSVKLSSLIAGIFLLTMSACVKDRNEQGTDFSNLQPLVEIRDNISGVGNDAGLANFGKASLNFTADPDTVSFYVNLASVNVLNHDVTVTVDVSQDALDAYNADPAHTIKYDLMPDSVYSFIKKDVVIKAGERVDNVSIELYPSKIDPSKSYMLPVSITDAGGINISGNFGTIYYHLIGNPLAGNYYQSFYRYNDIDTTLPPNSTVFEDQLVTVSPESPTTLFLPESYLQTFTGGGISLSFTNTNGVLSDFATSFNSSTLAGLADGGFTIVTSPKLVSYQLVCDASTKYAGTTFRTYMVVINSSGGKRSVIDNFVKQ